MAQAEFEFWKIDSAFEPTSISALLPERFISELLDGLVKKAVRVAYDARRLENALKNFGWELFLPLEKRDIFSAKQLYEHCRLKLVEKFGNDYVHKAYDNQFAAAKLVAVVYLAYKATEMLDQRFERGGVRVSSAGKCKMGLRELAQYLFITRGVPKDRLYTAVLSVLVYSTAADFRKGLESAQKEVKGYSIGRGATFGKEISDDVVRLLELSAQCATATKKGGKEESYQLFYRTGESQLKELKSALSGLGIGFQLRKGGNLSLDTITPFRIMANYFGLQRRLDRDSLSLMAHAASKRMGEKTAAPDIRQVEKEILIVPMDMEAGELRQRPRKESFWRFGRGWKRGEREQKPEKIREKPAPKPKKKKMPAYKPSIGKEEFEHKGGLFGLFHRWEKEPPIPDYDLSGIKFTKDSVREWVIRLYAGGADLSYENLKQKYPPLYEGVRSNFLVMGGMLLNSKPFLERAVKGILEAFFSRDEKILFEECINSELYMEALCRFAKDKRDLMLKRLCNRIALETENENVKRIYLRFFGS